MKSSPEIEQFAKEHNLDLIIIFGSQARGQGREDSDVDIAVRASTPLSLEQRLELSGKLDQYFPKVEIADLRQASPLLLAAIARDGKPLYEKVKGKFQEFILYAKNMYFDFKPALDRLKEQTKKEIMKLSYESS